MDWITGTWEWIADAFSNWDAELYDAKDELIRMMHQTGYGIRLIVSKLRDFISQIGEMLSMLMEGFKGWK